MGLTLRHRGWIRSGQRSRKTGSSGSQLAAERARSEPAASRPAGVLASGVSTQRMISRDLDEHDLDAVGILDPHLC